MSIHYKLTPFWHARMIVSKIRQRWLVLVTAAVFSSHTVASAAQDAAATPTSLPATPTSQIDSASKIATLFPHPESTRYLLSGQANIIFQAHAPFHSPYEGANSLVGRGEYKTSLIGTVYAAYQIRRDPRSTTEVIANLESAGGRGISQALGLAGFTNLDVVRNPNLGSVPYLARLQVHQSVGLSAEMVDSNRTQFSLATKVSARRVDLRLGKMSLPDYFDVNSIGTDSHLQFLNWTADNNGAWDYAADTRGYTYAGIIEYTDHAWTARYALAAMPTVQNGIDLDWAFHRASGQNMEVEYRGSLFGPLLSPQRKGTVRVLSFVNHAHMGLYREANAAFVNGDGATPDVTRHAPLSTVKYGFGINLEQELTPSVRVYSRLGWNEGQHQSFAYTEVDQTLAFGGDVSGTSWSRPGDKLGLTFISNAIKRDHQAYLRLGGRGFLLGDGTLNYAREDILESYYNLHAWRGLYYALDAQFIAHPGYNQDRGSVLVEAIRMHVDF